MQLISFPRLFPSLAPSFFFDFSAYTAFFPANQGPIFLSIFHLCPFVDTDPTEEKPVGFIPFPAFHDSHLFIPLKNTLLKNTLLENGGKGFI